MMGEKNLCVAVKYLPPVPQLEINCFTMPCTFQDEWLKKDEYRQWLTRDKLSNTRAQCFLCAKVIDVSTMGASALRSHMEGKKHSDKLTVKMKCMEISVDIEEPTISNSSSQASSQAKSKANSSSSCKSACSSTCSRPVTNQELKVADIWAALNVVNSGYSFYSCNNAAFLARQQFPDSAIAAQFSFAETKCMYMISHGLAPFCKKMLVKSVASEPYVLMFDESPHKKLQQKQMDVLIRFWDCGAVKSRVHPSA
jgi:hypothetical protein